MASLRLRILDDPDGLLKLCDEVRDSLQSDMCLGAEEERISRILNVMLKNEELEGGKKLDWPMISYTRLDKLLGEMMTCVCSQSLTSPRVRMAMHAATELARLWKVRFRADYPVADRQRYFYMPEDGLLRDMFFHGLNAAGNAIWQAKPAKLVSESEGTTSFEPGQ
jgi:hypothetical protein